MSKKSSFALKDHFLRDFSLEMSRPPLKNPQKGEQELQFSVSLHHAPGQNPGFYEVLLASRLVVWHAPTRQPLVVVDHAYTGMFHSAEGQKVEKDEAGEVAMAETLYPLARESLLQHLSHVGHTPPLPKTVDFKQNTKKP